MNTNILRIISSLMCMLSFGVLINLIGGIAKDMGILTIFIILPIILTIAFLLFFTIYVWTILFTEQEVKAEYNKTVKERKWFVENVDSVILHYITVKLGKEKTKNIVRKIK